MYGLCDYCFTETHFYANLCALLNVYIQSIKFGFSGFWVKARGVSGHGEWRLTSIIDFSAAKYIAILQGGPKTHESNLFWVRTTTVI